MLLRFFTLAICFFSFSSASANLITNGDFETGSLAGWTTFTTSNGSISGVPNSPGVTAFDTTGSGSSLAATFGVAEVRFDGTQQGGGIFQTFTSGAGTISISAAIAAFNSNSAQNAEGGVFNLLLDSVIVQTLTIGSINASEIIRDAFSYSGSVTAGLHELRFLITRPFTQPQNNGVGTLAQYLDNVVVNAPTTSIPEPATLGLIGLGLVGLGISRRKQAK